MKHFSSRGFIFATLTLFSLSASTLLTGCFDKEKDHEGDCNGPSGSVCNTAVTVVDLSATTGCGLALQLADGTYLIPTGSTWTDFHATAGQKLLVGYNLKKNDDDDQNSCTAGPAAKLGCVSVNTASGK